MKLNLKVDLLNKVKKRLRFRLTKSLKFNNKIVSKLNQPNSSQPSTPSTFPPSPPPPPAAMHRPVTPFLFPQANSTVLPDPSTFFSPHLLSSPLPTNSFFQNFVLNNGDQAEYFHPFLIKSATNSLSVSYPSFFTALAFIYQVFSPDLTISTARNAAQSDRRHVVTAAHDLSITLHLPPDLTFFLVRGSPFVTAAAARGAELAVTSAQSFLAVSSNPTRTKHRISLSNNQTWLCYSSSALELDHNSTTPPKVAGVVDGGDEGGEQKNRNIYLTAATKNFDPANRGGRLWSRSAGLGGGRRLSRKNEGEGKEGGEGEERPSSKDLGL